MVAPVKLTRRIAAMEEKTQEIVNARAFRDIRRALAQGDDEELSRILAEIPKKVHTAFVKAATDKELMEIFNRIGGEEDAEYIRGLSDDELLEICRELDAE